MTTKRPWKIGSHKSCIVADSNDGLTLGGSYGDQAIEYYGGNLIAESVSSANAELIVKAVNNHDPLVECLKQFVHLHTCEMEGMASGMPTPEQWMNHVRSAEELLNKIEQ